MKVRKLRRREFLQLGVGAAVGAIVTACATPEIIEIETTVEVEKIVEVEVEKTVEVETVVEVEKIVEVEKAIGEPPYLEAKIASGELPILAERLPMTPAIVGGRENIGTYGGETRMIHIDPTGFVNQYGWFAERMLQYSDLDLKTIYPNIFESWEMSEDGTKFDFHLRKGMKWSDGVDATTEDVDFWWNDINLNSEISGSVWWVYRLGGEVMDLVITDDYNFSVTFASPFGNFAAYLTRRTQGDFFDPKHYLMQFHADYVDKDELDGMVADAGYDTWVQLFGNRRGGRTIWGANENSPDHPMLSAWTVTTPPNQGLVQLERNPYYWKVDQAGNQLPYIDTLRIDLVASHEIVTLKIIQGELDYVGPHDVSIGRYPLYKENEPDNTYVVGDYLSCMSDRYTLYPQHNFTEDKVMEEIVNHPNYVKALSVAIDREEINQSLYYGLARMGQLGPMPASKYYKEKYGQAWAQYDPDLANQLLDEMGLDQRNSDGFRMRPDGDVLKFNIEHAGPRVGVSTHEFTEMVVTFWREVGIDATTREVEISLYDERMRNGLVHCGVWHADRCTDTLLPIEMRWYIPVNEAQGGPGQLWGRWFQNSEAEGAVEPPPEILELYGYYNTMNVTLDEATRVEAGQKIFDYLAENPLSIGSILECPAPLIFNKNMGNLPRPKMPVGWDTYGISAYHPEAFFYKGGERA